jgi:hypothetical protein
MMASVCRRGAMGSVWIPPKPRESMSEAAPWDDTSREDLRATLRNLVLGKVRLANSSHDDIVEICRDGLYRGRMPGERVGGFCSVCDS